MSWPLPQNNVFNTEGGHLQDHDNIWTSLNSGRSGVPVLVMLTDAATVAVNAALGSDFRLQTSGAVGYTRLIGLPSNPSDGQHITLTILQDSAGSRGVTWASAWAFPAGSPPLLSTAPNSADWFEFAYNLALGLWLCINSRFGFTNGTTVFFDNFAQIPNGQAPDASKWTTAVYGQQDDPTNSAAAYTDSTANCYVNSTAGPGGTPALVIAVTAASGASTVTPAVGAYRSARISTMVDSGLASSGNIARPGFRPTLFTPPFTFTCVAKVSTGLGAWPAIWMLGGSYGAPDPGAWPARGELDLYENYGTSSGTNYSYAYGDILGIGNQVGAAPTAWGNSYGNLTALYSAGPVNDGNFHTFAMAVTATQVSMSLDGTSYTGSPVTKTAWKAAASGAGFANAIWPYDSPGLLMGINLNVAVGQPAAAGPPNMAYPASGQTLPWNVLTVASVSVTSP